MRLVSEKLAVNLLEMGKKEFLLCGFQGVNLRSTAASMGVTTGAIYRYYTDKAGLSDALVEKLAVELLKRYREMQKSFSQLLLEQQLSDLPEISDNGQVWMVKHAYNNFDVFKLIICCSSDTRYEHYIDELVEIEANANRVLIGRMNESGYKLRPIGGELIHIASSALFNGVFETVRHDTSQDKVLAHMDGLREFYSAGRPKILGTSQLWFPIRF